MRGGRQKRPFPFVHRVVADYRLTKWVTRSQSGSRMDQFKVNLPTALATWIRGEAKRRMASESQVLREMILESYARKTKKRENGR